MIELSQKDGGGGEDDGTQPEDTGNVVLAFGQELV